MGERKKKLERMTPMERLAEQATHKLMDEGKIIEAGFVGFMLACFPGEQPSQIQRQEMHNAFMAGAQHLFSSIMVSLSKTGDDEPTQKDLDRMDKIAAELEAFGLVLQERVAKLSGFKGTA